MACLVQCKPRVCVSDCFRRPYSFTVAMLQRYTVIRWAIDGTIGHKGPVPAEVPAEATDWFKRRSIWFDDGRVCGISMNGLVRPAGNPLTQHTRYVCKYRYTL